MQGVSVVLFVQIRRRMQCYSTSRTVLLMLRYVLSLPYLFFSVSLLCQAEPTLLLTPTNNMPVTDGLKMSTKQVLPFSPSASQSPLCG